MAKSPKAMNSDEDASSLPDATLEQEIGAIIAASAKGNKDLEKEIELRYQPIKVVGDSNTKRICQWFKLHGSFMYNKRKEENE